MIKQGQLLKNDYNEHLASKWSSGHTMQLRAMQNQLHVQHTTNAKYKKYLHQGYKIQQGHKCVVLKIMQHNLKVLKKCYKAVI